MRADLEVGVCYLARQRLLHHFKQGRSANFLQRGVGHFCGSRGLRGIWEFKLFFFFNVYLFLGQRERQSMNGGGAEREGDTESETGSRL